MSCIRTDVWNSHKEKFLAQHDFNTRVESAIKNIERQMDNLSFLYPKPIERFSAPTHLACARASRLVCLCITNPLSREFAPAFLFLAGEQAMRPPDLALTALTTVKQELGW